MAKRMTDIGKIATSTPKFRDAPPTTPVFSVPKARTGVMRSTPEPAPAKANGHGEPVPTVPTGPRPNAWTVCQRILDALAELEQMGATEPPREMLAFMAGYSHVNSKGFANGMSPLRMQGLIEGGRLTAAGRAMAHPPPRPRTTAELQDRIINMLGGASARVLRPLLNAYPKGLERQALAEEAGYSHINSKGFAVAMARMRTLGFINTVSGAVFAQPLLFLEGA
jgi:hypothetical protein